MFALGFLAVVAVGYLDYVTSWQCKFTVLYFIPLSLTWFIGKRRGLILAVLCGIAATSTELSWGMPYDHPLIPYWNASSRLLIFLIFTCLISKIKSQVTGLEMAVVARMNELVKEIDEKKLLKKEKSEIYCALHSTLDEMGEGFVSMDQQWRYTYVNPAAVKFIGKEADELLGQVCWELFPESSYGLAYQELHRSVRENCVVVFDNYIPAPLNRWYQNRCYPSPKGISVFFTDISERKFAEEKFRDLTDHLETVREQERLAISREIHDEFGQALIAFKLDLSWIEHKFLPVDFQLTGRLNAMRSTLDLLVTKAQNIASELRPPLLDNLGLAAAIDWQVREFKRRCGIECLLMLNDGIKVHDKEVGTTVMRILQEALTNIAKHAKAQSVVVSLCETAANDLILEIVDDGRGIEQDEIHSALAFGLMGMRERARHCHGVLTIRGARGKGTTVRLEIPRETAKEAH